MKNKFNETDIDFGNTYHIVPKSNYKFSENEALPNEQNSNLRKIQWNNPLASRKLVKELLQLVNSEAEYNMLLKELAELDEIIALQSSKLKGGAFKMAEIITIKGKPVIEIYESFDGSYWFITEKLYKQDTVINGKVYKDDQILFGYVKLSACPEFAEWGNISETELKLLGNRVWKVPKKNWAICPEVEAMDKQEQSAAGEEVKASSLLKSYVSKCKEVIL
jgi:hypothetical protein